MGFLFPNLPVPDAPLAAGGFADRITAIMANRKKIDDERELKRRQDEAMARHAEILRQASEEANQARASEIASQVPETERANALQIASQSPEAEAYKGKVYANRGQLEAAIRKENEDRLRAEAAANRGQSLDQEEADYNAKVLKQKQLREGALNELKIAEASPEAQAAISAFYDRKIAEAKAAHDLAKSKLVDKNGKIIGRNAQERRANASSLDAMVQSIKEAEDQKDLAQGEGASFQRQHREFQAGISDEARKMLEMEEVINPLPARPDSRVQERYLARAVASKMPEILTLGRILPDQAKQTEAWLKTLAAQGDAASKSEVSSYEKERDRNVAMLNKYRLAEASLAKNSQDLLLKAKKLAQDGNYKDALVALGNAKLATERWKTNVNALNGQAIANIRGGYALQAAGATTGNFWTPEGQKLMEDQLNRTDSELAQLEDYLTGASARYGSDLYPGGVVAPRSQRSKRQTVTVKGKYPVISGDSRETSESKIAQGPYSAQLAEEEAARNSGIKKPGAIGHRPPKPVKAGFTFTWDGKEWVGEKAKGK